MATSSSPVCVFWFRRDLRLHDNAGLDLALSGALPVLPLFIFDSRILSRLEDRDDKRVEFIHQTLTALNSELGQNGSGLQVEHGAPLEVWKRLTEEFKIARVVTNHDYEPYAVERDEAVRKFLETKGIAFETCKDQVVFEKLEVTKDDGKPYTVFTPYSRKWKARLSDKDIAARPSIKKLSACLKRKPQVLMGLSELGFQSSGFAFPRTKVDNKLIANYGADRNTPSVKGTSHLGLHLRFGTVSPRELVGRAKSASQDDVWLNELIWREFFMQILWNFPHVVKAPFRPEYAGIEWRRDKEEFAAWCEGMTGYPLVDAGMRELNATGFMHNRVRMVAGSFLVKHLLIDWRWGEAYFARKLLDFDLASNNGNWQWVAGTGCDAAPYFRVFNPETQLKKFDPELRYVKHWVPEFGTSRYPQPIVDHVEARTRVLEVYKTGLGRKAPAPSRN